MRNQPTRLLAIDPGTRAIGYAEFEDSRLVDYGLKIIRRHRKIASTLNIIHFMVQRLVQDKRPTLMVIEKNSFSAIKQNAALVLAIWRMKAIARKSGVPVMEIAASTARKIVCGNGYATKRDVAKVLRSKFPELAIYIDPLKRHRQSLFLNVFDAVACGQAAISLTNRNEK